MQCARSPVFSLSGKWNPVALLSRSQLDITRIRSQVCIVLGVVRHLIFLSLFETINWIWNTWAFGWSERQQNEYVSLDCWWRALFQVWKGRFHFMAICPVWSHLLSLQEETFCLRQPTVEENLHLWILNGASFLHSTFQPFLRRCVSRRLAWVTRTRYDSESCSWAPRGGEPKLPKCQRTKQHGTAC